MNLFFTSGTDVYLKKLVEDHPNEVLLFMQNEGSFLLVHETEGNSFFKEPRKYEVIKSLGEFADEWENEWSFKNWKTSNSFEKVHSYIVEKEISKKQKSKFFPQPSFVTKYLIVIEDEKENQD